MIVKSEVTLQFTPQVMRKRTHLCSDILIQINRNRVIVFTWEKEEKKNKTVFNGINYQTM